MIVSTIKLTKRYYLGASVINAVENVNLQIEDAEFVVIFGPSGSGKTTLLNLIGLIDIPTSGSVIFRNKDTSRLNRKEKSKIRFQNIGFIFQTHNLLPTLTALENVELPITFTTMPQKAQREKATSLLESVGLSNRLQHKPKELSIGEMQRVAIARALANDPSLLIADEPTGELDSKTGSNIISLLSKLCNKQKSALIVATHDQEIINLATVKYNIQDGIISKI